jgi:hypothetical protein
MADKDDKLVNPDPPQPPGTPDPPDLDVDPKQFLKPAEQAKQADRNNVDEPPS